MGLKMYGIAQKQANYTAVFWHFYHHFYHTNPTRLHRNQERCGVCFWGIMSRMPLQQAYDGVFNRIFCIS